MIALINAPSILGLRFTGVELLPDALKQAGLMNNLHFTTVKTVTPPPYSAERDEVTHMLNPEGLATYAVDLATAVEEVRQSGGFPLVLGGDCSILLGNMLALKRQGRFGLFFLDGHADFYQPEASITGEAADMDLALVSGHGPAIVTNIENQKPLVKEEDIIQFGQRDRGETIQAGSQQILNTNIHVYELETIHSKGVKESVSEALRLLLKQPIDGFWIHIDADVLSDDELPAVDYRLPGGLTFSELETIVGMLLDSDKAVGLDLTVFNPRLDPDGSMAKKLVELLARLLKQKE